MQKFYYQRFIINIRVFSNPFICFHYKTWGCARHSIDTSLYIKPLYLSIGPVRINEQLPALMQFFSAAPVGVPVSLWCHRPCAPAKLVSFIMPRNYTFTSQQIVP